MTDEQTQLRLETKMYRKGKMFGRDKCCNFCWAQKHGRECITQSRTRHEGTHCASAFRRMKEA